MKCMKAKVEIVIVIFFGLLVTFWFQLTTFLGALCEFQVLSNEPSPLVVFGIALCFSIIGSGIAIYLLNTSKYTKVGNWVSTNVFTLLLLYTLSNIFCCAVKSTVIWSYERIKELLSLEWTIIGISITIFLVWNVIAIEYLDNKKPQKPTTSSPLSVMRYIQSKSDFTFETKSLLNNINLLLVNILSLLFATAIVYIGTAEASVLNQNMVLLTFFLCTNTVLGLFLDIFKYYFGRRRKLLADAKVTNADIILQNQIKEKTAKVLDSIDVINNLPNTSAEEKEKMTLKILISFLEGFPKASHNLQDENDDSIS